MGEILGEMQEIRRGRVRMQIARGFPPNHRTFSIFLRRCWWRLKMLPRQTCCFFPLTKSLSKLRSILTQERERISHYRWSAISSQAALLCPPRSFWSKDAMIARISRRRQGNIAGMLIAVIAKPIIANQGWRRRSFLIHPPTCIHRCLSRGISAIKMMVKINVDLKIRKEIIDSSKLCEFCIQSC